MNELVQLVLLDKIRQNKTKEDERRQKKTKIFASSGNRTRAARVAGEHSTTEPTMLDIVEENKTEAAGNLAKLN